MLLRPRRWFLTVAPRIAIAALLSGFDRRLPAWRLAPQPPPAVVLPVGDPVIPIDRG